jgi:hypothetical protein
MSMGSEPDHGLSSSQGPGLTTRADCLAVIDRAFAEPRPERFVRDPTHCEECIEHEATLAGATPETISLAEVGSLSWDPLCFAADEAFRYFMPGLARLAFGEGDAYYLDHLLFHLETGRTDTFTPSQKRAVRTLLDHLQTAIPDEIDADDRFAIRRIQEKCSSPGS